MAFRAAAKARLRRTRFMLEHREEFLAALEREIVAFARRARKRGMLPAIRLDGASDIGLARRFAERFPSIQFYDYTKSARRALAFARGELPPNWHITYSRRGGDDDTCHDLLARGVNVAVVFAVPRGKPLPREWHGYRVIDGDEHDARFTDPKGVVVGLRLKGQSFARARKRAGNFAV
jgi:hypothetical protein